jgi:HK97 family phage portal protein
MLTNFMNIFRRQKQSPLYASHPELEQRVPILRISSDGDTADGEITASYENMAVYYNSNVWVHKAIKVLSDNLSPLHVRVMRGDGKDQKPVENHPVSLLLDNPNPKTGSTEMWSEWVISMMLAGEFGLEVVRAASGKLAELWPREPQHITIHPGEFGSRYRNVKDYTIDDHCGDPYKLTPEQMIFFKFLNPLNPWRGIGTIAAVRNGILIDQFAQAWTKLLFKNNVLPAFAIIAPEGMTPTEKKDYLNDLELKAGGVNMGKPIILEKGITDIKTFSWPPKDIEWLQQRQLSRDEIGACFGVPDEMMGYGKDTYDNYNTADRVLWTLTIVPLIRFRDDVLTRFFRGINALGQNERTLTDLTSIPQLQEDRTAKINQWNILASRGVPINTASDYLGLGLPPCEGGDVGYLPMGLIQIGLSPVAPPEPTPAPLPEAPPKAVKVKALYPEYGSPQHEAIWKSKQSRIDKFVLEMQRIVKREFQRQQNDISSKLRNSREFGRGQYKTSIPPVTQLFDLEEERLAFIEALRKVIHDAINTIGQMSIEEVLAGGLFDITRPEVAGAIRQILEAVALKVNETTWLELIDLFQEAEAAGEGIVAMQERLSAYFGDRKSDFQTERIARTTLCGATGNADIEAWKQSEVVSGSTWISALIPDRSRDAHMEAHGQTAPLGGVFNVGGESLSYPGDPTGSPGNIINCLCVLVPEVMEL